MELKWLISAFLLLLACSGNCVGVSGGSETFSSTGVVSLSFDDGHYTMYDTVRPMLEAMGWKATFFIITSKMTTPDDTHMTTDQIKELYNDGYGIESHSDTHPHLTQLNDAQVQDELRVSKEKIAAINPDVNILGVPYGETNAKVDNIISQHYAFERTSVQGYNDLRAVDPRNIKVKVILNTTTDEELQEWLDWATQQKYWLVLMYHLVETQGEEYSISPETFQHHLQMIKESGLPVATMEDVLKTA